MEEEPKGMTITFDETVTEADKDSFDQNMQQYAELILALVSTRRKCSGPIPCVQTEPMKR